MLMKAVSIVITIFLMVALGAVLRRWGFLRGQGAPDLLSKLVVDIGLPSMMVAQLFRYYSRESLLAGLPALGIAYLSIALVFLLSFGVARLIHIPKGRQGVFMVLFTACNAIFIGLPVNQALFGEAALPATLLYYIANNSMFWVVGVIGIQRDGGVTGRLFSRERLLKLLTPPLIAFLACGTLILLGITLPDFLQQTAQYLSGTVTPLSLLFVGVMLSDMIVQGLRWQRGYGWVIAGRLLISPAMVLVLMRLFGGMSPLEQGAFLMQASMPAQTTCAIAAHTYRADAEYATGAVAITTLLSTVTIPLFAMLTTYL